MIGYACKPDGSWRCINIETMPLEPDEVFQEEQPRIIDKDPTA